MTFIVEIEHCVNCEQHRWNTNHDPRKYAKYLQDVNSAIKAEFPQCEVVVNPGQPWTSARLRYPRIGAFEIAVRTDRLGGQREVHSKLATGRWPNVPLVLKQMHLVLSGDNPIMVDQPHIWQRDYELFEAQERAIDSPQWMCACSPRAVSSLGMCKIQPRTPKNNGSLSSRARSVSPNSGHPVRVGSPTRPGVGQVAHIEAHDPAPAAIHAWESESNASPHGASWTPSSAFPSPKSTQAIQESRDLRKSASPEPGNLSRPPSTVPGAGEIREEAAEPEATQIEGTQGPAFAALQAKSGCTVPPAQNSAAVESEQLVETFKSTGSTHVPSVGADLHVDGESPTPLPEVTRTIEADPNDNADPYDCEFEGDDIPVAQAQVPAEEEKVGLRDPPMQSNASMAQVGAQQAETAATGLQPTTATHLSASQQSQFQEEPYEYEDEGFETDPDDRPAHHVARPETSMNTSAGNREYEISDDDEDLIQLPIRPEGQTAAAILRPETSLNNAAATGYEDDFEEDVEGMPLSPLSHPATEFTQEESISPSSQHRKDEGATGIYEDEAFEDDAEYEMHAGGAATDGASNYTEGVYLDEFDSNDDEVAQIAGQKDYDEDSIDGDLVPLDGEGEMMRSESSLLGGSIDLDGDDDYGDYSHERCGSSLGHERPGTSMGHDGHRPASSMGHGGHLQHWDDEDEDDEDEEISGVNRNYEGYDEVARIVEEGFNSSIDYSDEGDELN